MEVCWVDIGGYDFFILMLFFSFFFGFNEVVIFVSILLMVWEMFVIGICWLEVY